MSKPTLARGALSRFIARSASSRARVARMQVRFFDAVEVFVRSRMRAIVRPSPVLVDFVNSYVLRANYRVDHLHLASSFRNESCTGLAARNRSLPL